jgi:signal transduction histidine kinase
MKTSDYLELGRAYTRAELKRRFDITDETLKTGIFKPKGHSSIWLFITQSSDKHDYEDDIQGATLKFSGQSSKRSDAALTQHQDKKWELVVFYRREDRGAFTYCGRAEYVDHTERLNAPTKFMARLIDMQRDEKGEFSTLTLQDVVKEKVGFVADTHLIRVLGEQLIASEKVGILELIKNAYDAGATTCKVWIENVPNLSGNSEDGDISFQWSDEEVGQLQGPVITILDNGCGMDRNTLVHGWLRPATTLKTSVKQKLAEERKEADRRGTRATYEQLLNTLKQANSGRLVLGEKGVGRFATHRLGRYLTLQTKTKTDPYEWKLSIDWAQFDEVGSVPVDLSSIKLDLIRQKPELEYGPTDSGTRLRIFGGREGFEWTRDTLRDVGFAITLLRSPYKAPDSFDPEFICPQLGEEFDILTEVVPAPFRCFALVSNDGQADIEISFSPPPSLELPMSDESQKYTLDLRTSPYWRLDKKEAQRNTVLRQPECGAFFLDIKCWIRRAAWISGAETKAFTDYLDEFGGVGVFRDGLSILPAQEGTSGDWLNIERSIIKKGSNISYYNLYGSVEITQEENPRLVDKTNREGFIKTTPYRDLAELVRAAILELNRFVQSVRDKEDRIRLGPSISRATLNKQVRMTEDILESLSKNYDFSKDSAEILQVFKLEKSVEPEMPIGILRDLKHASNTLRAEVDRLQEQLDALYEMAGFAISVGVALHEIEKITRGLYQGLNRIVRLTKSGTDIHERALDLSKVAQGLLNELRRIAPLRVTRLEQKRLFSVRDAVIAAGGAFQRSWDTDAIEFEAPPRSDDFDVYGSFAACSQVFANLFDNATFWIKQTQTTDRRIGVFVYSESQRVLVADSGPGIAENMREHLFKPFFSLKPTPSGLGLYICRYYMRQLKGGDIREARPTEQVDGYKGAQFTLIFPKLEDGN